MIINLINNDVKFKLNQIIFKLLLVKFQQTLLMRAVFNNYRNVKF